MYTSKDLLNRIKGMRSSMVNADGASSEKRSIFKKLNFNPGDSKTVILLHNKSNDGDPFEYKFSHLFLRTFNVDDTCPLTHGMECPVCSILESNNFWEAYRTYIKNKVRGVYRQLMVKHIIRIYIYDPVSKNVYTTYFYDEDAISFLNFHAEHAVHNNFITITRQPDYRFEFSLPTQTGLHLDDNEKEKIRAVLPHVKNGPMTPQESMLTGGQLMTYFKKYVSSVSQPFYTSIFANEQIQQSVQFAPQQQPLEQQLNNALNGTNNSVNVGQMIASDSIPDGSIDEELF